MNTAEQKDGTTGERSPGEDRASCEEREKHKINSHSYNGSSRSQNVSAPGGRFIIKINLSGGSKCDVYFLVIFLPHLRKPTWLEQPVPNEVAD